MSHKPILQQLATEEVNCNSYCIFSTGLWYSFHSIGNIAAKQHVFCKSKWQFVIKSENGSDNGQTYFTLQNSL